MKSTIVQGFDWDDGNWPKCGKHGVSKDDIEAMFQKAPSVYPDPAHSQTEQRLRAIGVNDQGRYILAVFTIRSAEEGRRIRPISARFMHDKEVKSYEQR